MSLSRILRDLVNVILFVAGSLLSLRFILKLFSANASNDFVDWVYRMSAEILGPFRNIFPTISENGFIIEFSTLFALLVYGLIGMGAVALIDTLTPDEERRQSKTVKRRR